MVNHDSPPRAEKLALLLWEQHESAYVAEQYLKTVKARLDQLYMHPRREVYCEPITYADLKKEVNDIFSLHLYGRNKI